jgi:hypothetical protein
LISLNFMDKSLICFKSDIAEWAAAFVVHDGRQKCGQDTSADFASAFSKITRLRRVTRHALPGN